MNFKMSLTAKTIAITLFTSTSTVQAANWLMLQGTEPAGQSARAKVWGFAQVQYQQDDSDPSYAPNPAGGYIPPKLIGPNLDTQSAFNVNRARIGVRGTGFALDSKVNYFILAEFGNNGITAPGGYSPALTDASVTLSHIPGARIRVGQFKYPGAEEGLQAIHVFDYINFTTVTNQLLLERFPQNTDANAPPTPTPDANMAQYSRSVGAFRDVGIQIFDTFRKGTWEHSYAIMYGNGNGINQGDNDDNKDLYLYLSTENVYGGKGGRREGLKMFAWHQDGKRTNAYDKTQEQDRTRTGLGLKYLNKPFRVTTEYMVGEGMIFQGQHRPEHIFNDEEASGGYIEGGWYIANTNFEIDLRYDTYTRGENHPTSSTDDESTADTWTIGGQYHFNKKTRLNFEYADRNYESQSAAVDTQQTDVGGRFAVQLTHIF